MRNQYAPPTNIFRDLDDFTLPPLSLPSESNLAVLLFYRKNEREIGYSKRPNAFVPGMEHGN